MSDISPATLDPSDGTTPITLPIQDPCCESPCDPPWRIEPACITFNETKTAVFPLTSGPSLRDGGRGTITVHVSYAHRLCLVGKQHGALAYTLTLLPGETMTLYQSDRHRRTTSETARFSSQTSFSQFVSAVYQQNTSQDSSVLVQLLNNQSQSSTSSVSGGISIPLFGGVGGSSGSSKASSSSAATTISAWASSDQFLSVSHQASQYTEMQRSITISSFEDSESVSTTQRNLVNPNACYAVNYFVRRVMDVYTLTTTVTAVTFVVQAANYVSPELTGAQIGQLPAQFRGAVTARLKGLPTVGEVVEQPTPLTVPTDGVVYDPELTHCCVQDPELEEAGKIRLEREQAEAQKLGLEVQLMALEVQRRQALLAAGNLDPFEPVPATPVMA